MQPNKDWSSVPARDRVRHCCEQIAVLHDTLAKASAMIAKQTKQKCLGCGSSGFEHVGHCEVGALQELMANVLHATRIESRWFIGVWPGTEAA